MPKVQVRARDLKKPGKRRFNVTVTCHVELEVDQAVIDAVDEGWRKKFYSDMRTPEEIAGHIAFNMVRGDRPLDHIDGFADQPRESGIIMHSEWDYEAEEIT